MIRPVILTLLILLTGCHKGLRQPYRIETKPVESPAFADSVEQVWAYKLKAHPNQIIVLNDSLVLFGDSNGGVTVLNGHNGERIDRYWKPFKRPVQLYGIVDSVLYFSSETINEIMAWDIANAKNIWKRNFRFDYNEMIYDDSTLYLKSDSTLAKINALSGDTLSSVKLKGKSAAGFIYTHETFYVCSQNGQLCAFDKNLKNKGNVNLKLDVVESVSQHKELLIAYNTGGSIRLYSPVTGMIQYSKDFNELLYAPPTIQRDLVIVPYANGTVVAYSLENESQQWSYSFNSLLNLELLATEENLIIPYARGRVVGLDFSGHELWRYDHGKSVDYAALLHSGVLLGHRREISLTGVKNEN